MTTLILLAVAVAAQQAGPNPEPPPVVTLRLKSVEGALEKIQALEEVAEVSVDAKRRLACVTLRRGPIDVDKLVSKLIARECPAMSWPLIRLNVVVKGAHDREDLERLDSVLGGTRSIYDLRTPWRGATRLKLTLNADAERIDLVGLREKLEESGFALLESSHAVVSVPADASSLSKLRKVFGVVRVVNDGAGKAVVTFDGRWITGDQIRDAG